MIKNRTHSSIGCNGMANNDDYHGLKMYKNHAKDSTTEGYMQPDPTKGKVAESIFQKSRQRSYRVQAAEAAAAADPLYRQAAAAHHGTQCIAQLSEEANRATSSI